MQPIPALINSCRTSSLFRMIFFKNGRRGQPSFMTAARMRFHSMKSSALRSEGELLRTPSISPVL
jgi:hypothetical protein